MFPHSSGTVKRLSRGFSLVEAMVASTVLIASLTGVALMLMKTATNSKDGIVNVQIGIVARQLLHERTSNGLANVGQSVKDQSYKLQGQKGEVVELLYDIDVIDTSGTGPLPNLGYNSRLVRVTVRRRPNAFKKAIREEAYTHEAYVSE